MLVMSFLSSECSDLSKVNQQARGTPRRPRQGGLQRRTKNICGMNQLLILCYLLSFFTPALLSMYISIVALNQSHDPFHSFVRIHPFF